MRCPQCGRVADGKSCFACGYDWPAAGSDAAAPGPGSEESAPPPAPSSASSAALPPELALFADGPRPITGLHAVAPSGGAAAGGDPFQTPRHAPGLTPASTPAPALGDDLFADAGDGLDVLEDIAIDPPAEPAGELEDLMIDLGPEPGVPNGPAAAPLADPMSDLGDLFDEVSEPPAAATPPPLPPDETAEMGFDLDLDLEAPKPSEQKPGVGLDPSLDDIRLPEDPLSLPDDPLKLPDDPLKLPDDPLSLPDDPLAGLPSTQDLEKELFGATGMSFEAVSDRLGGTGSGPPAGATPARGTPGATGAEAEGFADRVGELAMRLESEGRLEDASLLYDVEALLRSIDH